MSEQLSLVQISNCELTTTTATFRDGLDYKDWQEAGKKLCRIGAATNFWIGDWLTYGETQYGEKYAAAIEATGLDAQTLMDYKWISGAVQTSLRKENLLWGHHKEVAPLGQKEQRKWLDKAEQGADGKRWTVSELRQAIRQAGAEHKLQPSSFTGVNPLTLTIKLQAHYRDYESWPVERLKAASDDLEPLVKVKEAIDKRLSEVSKDE
jgi:hypothetical protein